MRQRRFPRRFSQAGVTLVEVLVALVIFALIGAAGFTVLDQVARVDRLTEGRLARLEAMQRAMRVLSVDFGQARAQGLAGQGGAVVLKRSGGAAFGGPVVLRYGLEPGGSEPGGLEPGGLEPGGLEPGGLEPGGLEPGGLEPGGVEPGGLEPGGLTRSL